MVAALSTGATGCTIRTRTIRTRTMRTRGDDGFLPPPGVAAYSRRQTLPGRPIDTTDVDRPDDTESPNVEKYERVPSRTQNYVGLLDQGRIGPATANRFMLTTGNGSPSLCLCLFLAPDHGQTAMAGWHDA